MESAFTVCENRSIAHLWSTCKTHDLIIEDNPGTRAKQESPRELLPFPTDQRSRGGGGEEGLGSRKVFRLGPTGVSGFCVGSGFWAEQLEGWW